MNLSHPLVITLSLMIACLVVCIVLFVGMRSTAIVKRPGYRLGGAAAAFFLLFPFSFFVYSKTSALQPAPTPASIPAGYKPVVLQDAKLAMSIPTRYIPNSTISMLSYSDPKSTDSLIITSSFNESPADCASPEKLKQLFRNAVDTFPEIMPTLHITTVDIAPLNGLNSATASATVQQGTFTKDVTLRMICDPTFDKSVFLLYPTSTESTVMVSTISRKP